MNILLTGATGYVAQFIGKKLVHKGHKLFGVTRNPESSREKMSFPCQLVTLEEVKKLKNIDAVINLAGASVAGGRWSKAYKKELRESRVGLTKALLSNLDQSSLKSVVSASAIGYYADGASEEITEESEKHDGFIGNLCDDWEKAAFENTSVRVVSFRIGVVLGHLSAALLKMSTLFKSGAGAQLSDGKQFMSFIHVEDLSNMFVEAIENNKFDGIYNAVSPEPVTNKAFTKMLAKKLGVCLLSPPVPAFALKTLYGEMAQVLLRSHKIVPKRLVDEFNYDFKFKTIDSALEESITKLKTGEREVFKEIWINKNLEESFEFFKNEKNLEVLTPDFLNFRVEKKSTKEIQSETLIDYKLKLNGIPFSWRSKILDWNPPHLFTDTQVKGPYSKWHHTHKFESLGSGTLLTDHVIYKVPAGLVGRLAAGWKVAGDVRKIFTYRTNKVLELFSD